MSTPETLFLYTDAVGAAELAADKPRVLLLGGYLGYPNFGDILQLKGAIEWHRRVSGLEPIVLCDLAAVTDDRFTERLRNWFGVVSIVYFSDSAVDASRAGLHLFSDAARAAHLHVYGGGFLNRLWGPRVLRFVEHLHERFGVGHYVMSGQQAEPAMLSALCSHFTRCRPVLIGGRDRGTVELLTQTGVETAYSFDDAAEQMRLLADSLAADAPASNDSASLLLHLNASAYADDSPQPLEDLAARLDLLRDWAGETRAAMGPQQVTLLNAYNDARISDVADTLGTVQRLDDRFPFAAYQVVHLGRLAYELGSRTDGAARGARLLARSSGLALTCSYHAAMLCIMLDIPVWLETRNSYYRQKAAGLGLLSAGESSSDAPASRSEAEFKVFLGAPRRVTLAQQLNGRAQWLDQLRGAYETKPVSIVARPGQMPDPAKPNRAWIPKGGKAVAALPARAVGSIQLGPDPDGHAPAQSTGTDLQAWCGQLEQAKKWLESQLAAYRALADQRAVSIEELMAWNATLQETNARIDAVLLEHKHRADTVTGELVRATNDLAQAREGASWLEKQRGDWEAAARRNEADILKLKAWIHELEGAKEWLAKDRDRWKAAAESPRSLSPQPPG